MAEDFPDDGILLPTDVVVDAKEGDGLPLVAPKREIPFAEKFQILASCIQLINGPAMKKQLETQLFNEVSEFLNFKGGEDA